MADPSASDHTWLSDFVCSRQFAQENVLILEITLRLRSDCPDTRFHLRGHSRFLSGNACYCDSCAGLIPISFAIAVTTTRCSSIDAANSAARPGLTNWPVL